MQEAIVLGCGVSGLSSAICLLEEEFSVRIITREMPARTTSAVAGAIWHPLSSLGDRTLVRWAQETGEWFRLLVEDAESGVTVLPLQEPIPGEVADATWQAYLSAWRTIFPDLLALPGDALPPGYTRGVQYNTYVVETPVYMAYLLDRFRGLGGAIEQGEVADLDTLVERGRLVVNCTGAWAGRLTGDPRVYPIRGQIVRLAPQRQLAHAYHVSGGPLEVTYIFPRGGDCVLGGTYEVDNWSREPDERTSEAIWARCAQLEPSLAEAEVLDVRVGLRPGRDRVRLELEERANGPVIHNYGHGGLGFTFSWGCAADVARLARARSADS